MPLRHVVLVGLMGSGKTTVATLLARRLGWTIRDSDADLLAATGRSAREFAAADGIDRLHAWEIDHLLEALDGPDPTIIAAAASVIDAAGVRPRLEDPSILVAWLKIDAALATPRLARATHRPTPEALADQAKRRDVLFAAVADVVVDVGSASADAAAEAVMLVVEDWTGRSRRRHKGGRRVR